jgi:hypothetical protein
LGKDSLSQLKSLKEKKSMPKCGRISKFLRSSSVFACALALSLVPAFLSLTGCGGSGKTLTSIAVTDASNLTIAPGATDQFDAMGTYSDGTTADITSSVTWTSGTTTVATISSSGLATGVAAGTSVITATSGSVTGTATLNVMTAGPVLVSIAVTPSPVTLTVGETDPLTATGTYSSGPAQNITTLVAWTSSGPGATVNSSGVVTAVGGGTFTITAALSGVAGTASATVISALTSSGSTAILAVPTGTPFRTFSKGKAGPVARTNRKSIFPLQSGSLMDVAFVPQPNVANGSGFYTVQAVNLEGTTSSALLSSIAMPTDPTTSLPFVPNMTVGS